MKLKTTNTDFFIKGKDINTLISMLDYTDDDDHFFIIGGVWDFTEYLKSSTFDLYLNGKPWNADNTHLEISGIGVFRKFDDKLPITVIVQEDQKVYIFDEYWIDYTSNRCDEEIAYLVLEFATAFDENISFKTLMEKIVNIKVEDNTKKDN